MAFFPLRSPAFAAGHSGLSIPRNGREARSPAGSRVEDPIEEVGQKIDDEEDDSEHEQEVEEGRDPVELDDEIIEAMRFVTPPPEAPVNKTNREKYSCPVCHINLWGKPGIVVYCGGEHCNKAALVVLK